MPKKPSKARPKARAKGRTTGPARTSTTVHGANSLQSARVIPGELFLGAGEIEAFAGRATIGMTVRNRGNRPVQVGSHCHFFEVNRALRFDRDKAFGFRLCIPAGTAVRFEPGEEKRVTLVAIGGKRVAYGINGLTEGRLDDASVRAKALARAGERGFL